MVNKKKTKKPNNLIGLGDRLKEKRLERRLTQTYIAERIGVERAAVSQWEKNATLPRGNNLFQLCKLLDCDIAWLQVGQTSRTNQTNDPELDGLSSTAVLIMQRVRELDKDNDPRLSAVLSLLGEPEIDI